MSARKIQQQDLNISGFSPLKLNTQSPADRNSTSLKDYGILDAIENGREKVTSGYDKWRIASSSGQQCISNIHGIKEKAMKSNDSNYPDELEQYCKKLESIQAVYISAINQITTLITQMRSSINILTTMNDNDELRCQIVTIEKFLNRLRSLYEEELKVKNYVIENIAHTNSTEDSHLLLASWSCNVTSNELHKLMMQLKISPNDYRWIT